jgi:hypothetical protein
MDRTLIIGVIIGIILALAGLGAAIICIINYGFGNALTIIFLAVFFVGLLISGIVWSQ